MKRSMLLISIVGTVFVTSLALRIRSHLIGDTASTHQIDEGKGADGDPTLPRDYVVHPWVAEDELNRGPERIVSLAPSITELLCAMGLRDRIVGRTPYCTHPPGIEAVADVGTLDSVNFDRIKGLQPQLVLTTANSGSTVTGLEKLGMNCATIPHDTLEQVYTAIDRLGELCERPKTAAALIGSIKVDLRSLSRMASTSAAGGQNVLIILGSLPVPPQPVWVAGPGSFLDSLLTLAGQKNAVRDIVSQSHAELSLEKLAPLDIDTVLTFGPTLSADEETNLYNSWSQVVTWPAITKHQIRRVGGKEWLSAGPRLPIALHQMIRALSEP